MTLPPIPSMRLTFLLLVSVAASLLEPAEAQITRSGPAVPAGSPPIVGEFLGTVALTHAAETRASLSGTTGQTWEEVSVPDGAWVYGVRIGESRSFTPCAVRLDWATLEEGELVRGSEELVRCGGSAVSMNRARFRIAEPTDVAPANAASALGVVTSVTACQADGKQVAGVTIGGQSISRLNGPSADLGVGGMHGPNDVPSFRTRSCTTAQPSSCGTGDRAKTGVRVALRQASGDQVVVGLQASCARLEVKR